ncbi:MAG: hypothetical protein M1445_06110 [Bacteroidetes bacterium]|nr:hypothetical protein [Bacteroidota bacterium]
MTNLEALKAEIEPYTLSKAALEKSLVDVGLTGSANYTDEMSVAKAVVKSLSKLVVLAKESEGKFSQDYAAGTLEKRILGICSKFGFDASEFVPVSSVSDGSNRW